MTDDRLPAALVEIRARLATACTYGYYDYYRQIAGDLRKALNALDTVRGLHERVPVYGLAASEQFPGRCPHGPDYDGDAHFEDDSDGEWLCTSLPGGAVCASCTDEDGMREGWPCPTVAAITRELTREAEKTTVQEAAG